VRKQGYRQHLVHVIDGHEVDLLANRLWNFLEVPLILSRDDNRRQTRPMGSQHLVSQSPDGKNPPAQSDLTRHTDLMRDRALTERRYQCRGNRDTGGWPILWYSALRNVHMDVSPFVEVVGNA
jgi:hypothetical protein